MESITRFIATKLKLQVNQQKSAVARPWSESFWIQLHERFQPKRRIAPKAVERFKERVRELTSRTSGVGTGTDGRGSDPVSTGMARLFREV